MSPAFSVILPTYNRVYVVWRSIQSVLAQTLEDFELLIVDDGSTDATPRLVEEFRDERIRMLSVPRGPRGPSAARNVGLAESTGQLIAYLDSDDSWPPEYLARMKRAAETHPSGNLFYADQIATIWERTAARDWHLVTVRNTSQKEFTLADARNIRWPGITGIIHRRSLLAELKGFDEALHWLEDWDFFFRAMLANSCQCQRVPGIVVPYRQIHGQGADGICAQARESGELEVAHRRKILTKWQRHLSASAIARMSISASDIKPLRARQ
jgi:glycosyltransferase involved in cell wall biosynthesis